MNRAEVRRKKAIRDDFHPFIDIEAEVSRAGHESDDEEHELGK